MDRAPRFEEPTPDDTPEARRKRRRLEGFGWNQEPEEPQPIFEQSEPTPDDGHIQELWNREEPDALRAEPQAPAELDVPAFGAVVHEHGQQVVEQSGQVSAFARKVRKGVDDLSQPAQDELAPETSRLDTATEDLDTATDDLEDDLGQLDEAVQAPYSSPSEHAGSAAATTPEAPPKVEKPKEQEEKSGTGMARLVIATLIGGGLGALIGGEEFKKRKAAKEKAKLVKSKEKAEQTVKQQEVKIAQQGIELDQLKTQRTPETAAPQKEIVKSATDLAERQADLTRETSEQVRAATDVVETSRTFHIPEQAPRQPEKVGATAVEAGAEVLQAETGERLKQDKPEPRRAEEAQPLREYVRSSATGTPSSSISNQQVPPTTPRPIEPRRQATQTTVYFVLLALAAAIMLALLIFGPK